MTFEVFSSLFDSVVLRNTGQQDTAGVWPRGAAAGAQAQLAQGRACRREGRTAWGGAGTAGPSRPGSGGGTAGGEAVGLAAMWTSFGARSESAGPRAASGRLWALVLGAAAGFFLLGFLIGTVQTNPPSHRGLVQLGDVARSRAEEGPG